MKFYSIIPQSMPLPMLRGREFDPAQEPFCKAVPHAKIDSYVWGQSYTPEARAWMVWDRKGLSVLLAAREARIRVEATAFNGEVYRDSCLECFLKPISEDPRYLNIEVNASGTALIGLGQDRQSRVRLPEMPRDMGICASEHRGNWWAVAYRISFALIQDLFGAVPRPGDAMRGNFYKCDESIHPHFGSWNPIQAPAPDFHRPECFGTLVLSKSAES